MLIPSENLPAPHEHRLKKTVAKQKSSVENRNHGFLFWNKFAVEKYNHAVMKRRGWSWSAAKNPPALAIVSSYSASATESATIPAPTWKWISPARHTAVR